ncbi:MAG: hypothetical protein SF187_21520 [Deltaproteobacteria bacterium]|nr:hypothetical protein [Deltaproteobacteria bacterium]
MANVEGALVGATRRKGFARVSAGLLLLAASAGVTIPALKALTGSGLAGGLFVASHVAGTLVAASLLGRLSSANLLRLQRRVALLLGVSAALNLGMFFARYELMLLLRFVEGMSHIVLVTFTMSQRFSASPKLHQRASTWLGVILVIGVGMGMGIGGGLAHQGVRLGFVGAALLCVVAGFVLTKPISQGSELVRTHLKQGVASASALPGVMVAAERFSLGLLSVVLPFALGSAALSGATLGIIMLSSVITAPLAYLLASRTSPRNACQIGAAALALALVGLGAVLTASDAAMFAVAVFTGGAAGLVFTGAILQATAQPDEERRARCMGLLHALGGLGFFVGSLVGGGVAWLGTHGIRPGAGVAFCFVPLLLAMAFARFHTRAVSPGLPH